MHICILCPVLLMVLFPNLSIKGLNRCSENGMRSCLLAAYFLKAGEYQKVTDTK